MSDTAPIRYGVLSAANIARAFIRGVTGSKLATVAAVASRDEAKAKAFAQECGIPRALGSYEALLADKEIDAVYIPLPNDMHAEWAIKAAEAGKHILCEKPLCMNLAEAKRMFDAAKAHGVHLVEGYPYMSQPQTTRVRELLAEGVIGRIQLVQSSFGFGLVSPDGVPHGDPKNIRLLPERGGGGLFDAGSYSVSFARMAVGERPVKAIATARWTKTGVDQTIAATLTFASGAIAQVTSTMSASSHRHAVIVGDKGIIESNYSNHAPDAGRLFIRVKRGTAATAQLDVEEVEGGNGFRAEAESFAELIRGGSWNGATEAESLDVAASLDAIAKSAKTEAWVNV